MVIKKRALNSN